MYSKARQCEWQKFALVKCPRVDKKMGKVNFQRKKTLPKSDLGCLPRGLHLSGAFQGNSRCSSGAFQGNSRCISGGFRMHFRGIQRSIDESASLGKINYIHRDKPITMYPFDFWNWMNKQEGVFQKMVMHLTWLKKPKGSTLSIGGVVAP